jgi:hypothetical protein
MQAIPQVYQITVRYANFFLIVEESLTLIGTGFRGSVSYMLSIFKGWGKT